MVLAEGSELEDGKYRILRLLDRGGMGSVFEAEHTRSHKRVAIKCLHPRRQGSAADMERILREAQASARVRHRNVVEVFDVSCEGDLCYLVMEYLEGETFRKVLGRELPVHTLISLLLQAMRGVAAAHKQGVIHRDIKPENLFLAREEDAREPVMKVLDFGISKLAADEAQQPLTATGAALGTPHYMPYEQLSGRKDIDGRADVYAFGVVLYEALTGRLPYEGHGIVEVCCRVLETSPVPPKALRPELPTTLSNVVMWALKKDREARIPSMKQLIRELEPFSTLRGMQAELSASDDALVPGSILDLDTEPAAGDAHGRPARSVVSKPARASLATPPGLGAALRQGLQTLAAPGSRNVWLAAVALAAVVPLLIVMRPDGQAPHPAQPEAEMPPSRAREPVPAPTPAAPSTVVPPAPAAPVIAPIPEKLDHGSARSPGRSHDAPALHSMHADAASAHAVERSRKSSSILSQAAARNEAKIQLLKEQLVQCGELRTRAIREQCQADHKREIAEYEGQRALLEPVSDH